MPTMQAMAAMPTISPMPWGWTTLTDEQLRAKFDELDKDKNGVLCRPEIAEALRGFGRTEDEIQKELARMTRPELDFADFRLIAKPPQRAGIIHDVPGLGALTATMTESSWASVSDHDLNDAFNKVDLDHTGALGKDGMADAMRQLGMCERQINNRVKDLPEGTSLHIDGFKELVRTKPPSTGLPAAGFAAMLPNPAHIVGAAASLTDEQLKDKFEEHDQNKDGLLCRSEIEAALLELGRPAEEIEEELKRIRSRELDFEHFRLLAKPPQKASRIHGVPVVGDVTSRLCDTLYNNVPAFKMSDAELSDAFHKFDLDGSRMLDKSEITSALQQLGKCEKSIHRLVGGMPADGLLDLEAFKALVKSSTGTPVFIVLKKRDAHVEGAPVDKRLPAD